MGVELMLNTSFVCLEKIESSIRHALDSKLLKPETAIRTSWVRSIEAQLDKGVF